MRLFSCLPAATTHSVPLPDQQPAMNGSPFSRAAAPPALDRGCARQAFPISSPTTSSASTAHDVPRSFTGDRSLSSPAVAATYRPPKSPTALTSSSASSSPQFLSRRSSSQKNANSYCGRHTNQFLFGGRGIGDLWRRVFVEKG